MIQIIFLGVLAILGLFGLSKVEKITKTSFILISVIIVVLAIILSIFEQENDAYKTKATKLNLDFVQSKTIICGDYNISNKTFNITSNSFVAKQNSKYLGSIIPFQDCSQD